MTTGAASEAAQTVRGLHWVTIGRSARAAWGRCRGSAAEPYRTVVSATRTTVTSCSCPSRRRPCKHALTLADLAADGQLAVIEEPDWVEAVVSRPPFTEPQSRQLGDARPHTGPADPEAAAKRAEARQAKVGAGLAELQLWLGDQVRAGLASLPRAGYGHFDAIAARLVDAQAPGVAGTLRSLPGQLVAADWPDRVLHAFGGLHLLAEAHTRLAELPGDLAATVRSRIGYPVTKEQVRARPPAADTWWAVAAVDTVEFQLTSRRVWLRGLDSGRWALWLTFAPPEGKLDTSIRPGRTYTCEARFYPGSGQFRALIEPPLPGPDLPIGHPEASPAALVGRSWGGDDLATVRDQFAALMADDPWTSRLPVVVAGVPVVPRHADDPWLVCDAAGTIVPLIELDGAPWPLVAQAGGDPVQVMGEYDGRGLRPLAVLPDRRGRRYNTVLTG